MNKKNERNNSDEEKEIDFDIKELVKMRLGTIPKGVSVSIGSQGSFKAEELVKHIDLDDEIGKIIVEIDMEFLRDLKNGKIYEQIAFNNAAKL
ncbi:MAG: hypothetical protein A2288_02485 [Candidatus Moranbacteria bacterium RIFOXYA12_FULL_44_15]|nr:MAG: hypothetical protein A2288_02485 [Candidatus Moranbacteria bacterium RIFOXYA12_FULL_44_15]OGI34324.1 MAG: hypothetical protein A2259_03355 [Candidatus Moranbacteria bacterium RIFOXYA2_FULL_43_15]